MPLARQSRSRKGNIGGGPLRGRQRAHGAVFTIPNRELSMDRTTLAAYDADPQAYVMRWLGEPEPTGLQALIRAHFKPGGDTADIGSGSGRLTAWLAAQGYVVAGFDASAGLLTQARARHPRIEFRQAALPELAGVAPASFDNVLCKTVIMHLPHAEIAPAVARMAALLKPGGVLLLNWRVTRAADERDGQGRLYSAFDSAVVSEALSAQTILLDEEDLRPSGKAYHTLIARAVGSAGP
jgi:SAM-dependent methyltransferase